MAGVSGAQGRAQLSALLSRHGLSPKRRLGQHFLGDPNTTRKIVETSGVAEGSRVVEVGVGTGTLTAELAATGATVVGYEVDEALAPLLAEVVGDQPNVELRFEDAAKVDLASDLDGDGWIMVANLPYHVGTPIVLDALRHVPKIVRFVVMVQVEVARRFVASVGDPDFGLPSVVVHLHGNARIALRVPASVFVPPPNVESAVVMIERKHASPLAENAIELAGAGFGQRRKMLRRSLATVLVDPSTSLEEAGIDPTARAEELVPEDWLRLAEVVHA
jgi:16S rRNA (adenine1518-N6/adenine1519-N6)-dimethyltransferase